jgi:hypothetical protein
MPDHYSEAQWRRHIDRNLMRVYQDALRMDVPDRFATLLTALKKKGEGEDSDKSQ